MCTYLPAVLAVLLFLSLAIPPSLSISLAFFMLSAGNLCAAAEPRLSPIRTASWFRLTSSHMPHTLTHICAHMPLAVSVCVFMCMCLFVLFTEHHSTCDARLICSDFQRHHQQPPAVCARIYVCV